MYTKIWPCLIILFPALQHSLRQERRYHSHQNLVVPCYFFSILAPPFAINRSLSNYLLYEGVIRLSCWLLIA